MPVRAMQSASSSQGGTLVESQYNQQRKTSVGGGLEDASSGGDSRVRRKLQKSPSATAKTLRRQEASSTTDSPESRANLSNRRRPSILNSKASSGAKTTNSETTTPSSNDRTAIANRTVSSTVRPLPRSRQTSISKPSSFNFGTSSIEQSNDAESTSDPFQFLPPVNFDDLHTSITLGDSGFGALFANDIPTTASRRAVGSASGSEKIPPRDTPKGQFGQDSNTRIGRSASFLRAHSGGMAQKDDSPAKTNLMGPPALPVGAKPRRQSQFPLSVSASSFPQPPRKSIGPGSLQPSISDATLSRNERLEDSNTDQGSIRVKQAMNPEWETSGYLRIEEPSVPSGGSSPWARSREFTARPVQDFYTPASATPENPWATSISASRSPVRDVNPGLGTPSSSRRLSMMPGHATGLGARTVSPTDARRMKRLSMMPNPPPMPFTPPMSFPEPPHLGRRSAQNSPSLIPRKSVTPSSSRTTPDPNRKSYSSAISNSSNTSYNSLRVTASSSRAQQSSSSSRLPTPKNRSDSVPIAGEEEVPPVPAIPKAYESPQTEFDIPFFSSRKSSIPFDTASVNSTSTPEYVSALSRQSSHKETGRSEREARNRRGLTLANEAHAHDDAGSVSQRAKHLQPLRLPPLNLLPLNTPTTEKIAAMHRGAADVGFAAVTPPPKRGPKTPSTPMTASKATFSAKGYPREDTGPASSQLRSSSSHYTLRPDHPSFGAASSSNVSIQGVADSRPGRKAVSPFVSSSLPKTGAEFGTLQKKPSGDGINSTVGTEARPSRLTGPRPQTSSKQPKTDSETTPSDVEHTSFGTTLRRKLSLTRKRSVSKAEVEAPPQPPKHDAMPPPRLPASATWTGLSNIPSTERTGFLQSRRKTSHPDVLTKHERSKSSISLPDGSVEKESASSSGDISQASSRTVVPTVSRSNSTWRLDGMNGAAGGPKLHLIDTFKLDRDDLLAEDEMNRLAHKRKNTELAARELDELRRRAVAKDRVTPAQAVRIANLNRYELGEVVDQEEVYFCGTLGAQKIQGDIESSPNFGFDDERGDYNIIVGDHILYRYEVIDILGKGSFGQVVRCVDHKLGSLVAIKIIRNKKRFHQQALVEVNILQKLRDWDPHNKCSMVNYTQSFYFRSHLCITTELLDMNLYEFIKTHDFRGFSLKLIRRFTKQMLNSLVLLKSHKVIHCDLKPENILLAHPAHSEIKVIDFGSSCLENEKVYTYIQSRFYRSPEVILGMTYGMPIDMWSLGCILAELLTGYPIFPGENEQEQLACIMEVFGPPDKHLIERSTRKKLFFDSLGKPRLTVSSKGKRRRPSSKTLQQALKCDDEPFLDFLARCLRWDPDRRLKPDEAVHHEFITGVKPTPAPAQVQAALRSLRTLANQPQSSTAAAAATSPIRRFNSVHTPSSSSAYRAHPEPPNTSLKNGVPIRTRELQNAAGSGSPSKALPKRHTIVGLPNGAAAVALGRKGAGTSSTMPTGLSANSALPRLGNAPRLAGGKPDLASAAASLAVATRSPQTSARPFAV